MGQCKNILLVDPEIVLAWTQTPATSCKIFVANRVRFIHQDSIPDEWNHVPTKHNPADIAFRGILPEELVDSTLWWNDPHWLLEDTLAHAKSYAGKAQHGLTTANQEIIVDKMRLMLTVSTELINEPHPFTRY